MTRLHAVVAYVLAQPIAVELSPASILSGAIGIGLALLGWSLLRHIAALDKTIEKQGEENAALRERLHALERDIPERLARARHDAVGAVTPQVTALQASVARLERKVAVLEDRAA